MYEIKHDPVTVKGIVYDKYNIYYYDKNGNFEFHEFHSNDGINGTIREGYTEKTK